MFAWNARKADVLLSCWAHYLENKCLLTLIIDLSFGLVDFQQVDCYLTAL